jgi:hypothetical protein
MERKDFIEIGGNLSGVIFLLAIFAVGALFIWQYFYPAICTVELDGTGAITGRLAESFNVQNLAFMNAPMQNASFQIDSVGGAVHFKGQIYCRDIGIAAMALSNMKGNQYTITKVN